MKSLSAAEPRKAGYCSEARFLPTPPLPADALSFPSVHQMAPDLFLHLVFDVVEALAGVSDREVVDPSM
jgi:hypothetical protein